jgi:hypothetical protein
LTEGLPNLGAVGSRRDEDIALDMMKFIALQTGYGRTSSGGTGFKGETPSRADEHAGHLIELYTRCLQAVGKKK